MPDYVWILLAAALVVVIGVIMFLSARRRDRASPLASPPARIKLLLILLMGAGAPITATPMEALLYGRVMGASALGSSIGVMSGWALMLFVVEPRWFSRRPDKQRTTDV